MGSGKMKKVNTVSEYKNFLKDVVNEIKQARYKAYRTINKQLVDLYLFLGKNTYEKIEVSKWGEGIVEMLSIDLQRAFPDMKGFSKENLWRMKQLYETYKDHPKLSPLVTELTWSNNLIILHQTQIIDKKLLKQKLHSLPLPNDSDEIKYST